MKLHQIIIAVTLSVFPLAAYGNNLEPTKINGSSSTAAKTNFDWSGLYVGVNGGYSYGYFKDEEYGGWYGNSVSGYSYGGQIGYNFGLGQSKTILGIEAEYDKDTVSGANKNWSITYHKKSSTSLMGRLGLGLDSYMPYAIAGFSSGSLSYDTESTVDYPGWTAGLGTEIALTNNLVGRVEYRYSDFGSTWHLGGYTVHIFDSTVRFGLNYYFH